MTAKPRRGNSELLSQADVERRILERMDERALEEFLHRLYPWLCRYMRVRFGFATETTDDLVQETLILLLLKRTSIEKLRPWFIGTAINKALNHVAKEAGHREHLKSFLQSGISLAEEFNSVMEAFEHLNPKERQVLYCLHMEGYTFQEASRKLGLSRKTLTKHRNRAIEKLKGFFDENIPSG